VATKSRAEAAAILAPKVAGTRVLGEVFPDGLDFLFLCSSISTAAGVFAGVDYASANAYLDAYASRHHGRPYPVLAAGWDTWRDVGIAARASVPESMRAAFEESLRAAITPAEGAAAFERLLAAGLPQVYVATRDLCLRDELARRAPGGAAGSAPARAGAAEAAPEVAKRGKQRKTHARPKLSTPFAAATSEVEREIAAMWADLLGLDQVGVHDNFFELGGNSLVMMQVNVRLRASFGLSLPVRELFELPSAASLAERIDVIRALSGVGEAAPASEDVEEFTL
jgi:hypothetical protein